MVKLLEEINVVITHWMFNGKAFEKLGKVIEWSNWIIQKIYITDSINKEGLPDFVEVISLEKIIANSIVGIYKGLWINKNNNEDYLEDTWS